MIKKYYYAMNGKNVCANIYEGMQYFGGVNHHVLRNWLCMHHQILLLSWHEDRREYLLETPKGVFVLAEGCFVVRSYANNFYVYNNPITFKQQFKECKDEKKDKIVHSN